MSTIKTLAKNLKRAALEHGDDKMAKICDRAIGGDREAIESVINVRWDTAAQLDPEDDGYGDNPWDDIADDMDDDRQQEVCADGSDTICLGDDYDFDLVLSGGRWVTTSKQVPDMRDELITLGDYAEDGMVQAIRRAVADPAAVDVRSDLATWAADPDDDDVNSDPPMAWDRLCDVAEVWA